MSTSVVHRIIAAGSVVALGAAFGAGCGNSGGEAKTSEAKPATTAPAAEAKTAAPTKAAEPAKTAEPAPAAAAAPAGGQTDSSKYPMTGFRPVADTCKNASVVLASSPANPPPKWVFIRAALAAHREFAVDGSGPNGVTFEMAPSADNKSITLIGSCGSGATCNRLAATYKAVVPTSKPQVYCGDPPGTKNKGRLPLDPMIPDAKADTMEKCARIGVCMRALDFSGSNDPALECQKAPTRFKLDCATKQTCADVVACAK